LLGAHLLPPVAKQSKTRPEGYRSGLW